ncbi:MAG: hypothetical protein ABSH34_26075 [Verrucomicrobiota bacterium]
MVCASFSPDGQRVVRASLDHTARVWDPHTGRPMTAPLTHASNVLHAAFSPDGRRVVAASMVNTARVWDACLASSTKSRPYLPRQPAHLPSQTNQGNSDGMQAHDRGNLQSPSYPHGAQRNPEPETPIDDPRHLC